MRNRVLAATANVRRPRGISEVTLVVAMFVIALTLAGVATSLLAYSRTVARATLETQAADAAQAVFEIANSTPWRDLAMAEGDLGLNDEHVLALAGDQPFVTLPEDQFDKFAPTPAIATGETDTFGTLNENMRVYTAVTWEREPAVSSETGQHVDGFGTKRVSVLVVWGEMESQSQTFTMLRTPTVAEAVPTSVNIGLGGGLNVVRDVNAPVLTGDWRTGVLEATITKAFEWEIQVSTSPSFDSYEVLCGGGYPVIQNADETCTYTWKESIGYAPSFRVMVTTIDVDDDDSTADGVKFSNVVTFDPPRIAALRGGKTAWNRDEVFWDATEGLLRAEELTEVATIVYRTVGTDPQPEIIRLAYSDVGGGMAWDTAEGEVTHYKVCTEVNGVEVACSSTLGPLVTVSKPDAPDLEGSAKTGTIFSNWSWSSDAGSYSGAGGRGLTFDVQMRNGADEWETLDTDTTSTSLTDLPSPMKADGYRATTTTVRVRAKNDAGVSAWAERTVTVLGLPNAPTVNGSLVPGALYTNWSWSSNGPTYIGGAGFSFDVEQKNAEGQWERLSSNTTTLTRNGVLPPANAQGVLSPYVTLRVRMHNDAGVSAWAERTVVPPLPVAGSVSVASVNSAEVSATWSPNYPHVTSHTVTFIVNGVARSPQTFGPGTTSTTLTGLVPGDKVKVQYSYTSPFGSSPTITSSEITLSIPAPPSLTVSGAPTTSGGRITATSSCAAGLTPQYRYKTASGTFTAWGTSNQYNVSFAYGYGSGTVTVESRCVNAVSQMTSATKSGTGSVPYRLLVVGSPTSSGWNQNAFDRLAQRVGGTIGNNFGRNPWNTTAWTYSANTVYLQSYMNNSGGPLMGPIAADGYWGQATTGKIRAHIRWFCDASAPSGNAHFNDAGRTPYYLMVCLNSNSF